MSSQRVMGQRGKKLPMSVFRDGFVGRPAAVLGGGPSLPGNMEKLPEGCLLIAVNYHVFHLVRADKPSIEPDFMVYNDDPESDPLLKWAVEHTHAVRISPHPSADVEFDVPVWTGFYSSNTAAWLGLWMGCDPVILCGMDCYQGEQVYCHPSERDEPCFHYPLEDHLRPWREDGKNLLPHLERLRVMSGPLTRIFPTYEPLEVINGKNI